MPGGYSAGRPHGYAEWGGEGKTVARDSLMCCHCNAHFWVTPGSGKRRGFCMLCAKVTCGREQCDACVPVEVMLDNRAAGRPLGHRAIVARVEAAPPTGQTSPGGVILGKA
jgi:hypothetical protein